MLGLSPGDPVLVSNQPPLYLITYEWQLGKTAILSITPAAATPPGISYKEGKMNRSEIIDIAVSWALQVAADPAAGYSQSVRWGPSYDCSSLLIQAWENAFHKDKCYGPKSLGATYTGNMLPAFLNCGFEDVTAAVNLNNGAGLQKGDVLLNVQNHTAMVTAPGVIVHARSSEGTNDTADNSGNEIRTQGYWNYPWDYVLRLKGEKNMASQEKTYTVKAGDTLSLIAWKNDTTVQELARINGIQNPNVIRVGMVLKLQEAEEAQEEAPDTEEEKPADAEYVLGLIEAEMEAHEAKMKNLLKALRAEIE